MYVRHQAWLSASPESGDKKKDTRNRYKRYSQKNPEAPELEMPDISGAEYIIELLHECGPVGSNGYGVEGLKWSEIQSWLQLTGLFLCPWEVSLIKELSNAFASEFNNSNGKDVPPPYTALPKVLPTKEELNAKFSSIFNSMVVKEG